MMADTPCSFSASGTTAAARREDAQIGEAGEEQLDRDQHDVLVPMEPMPSPRRTNIGKCPLAFPA